METVRRNNTTKHNSAFRRYQAQPLRDALDDFYTDYPFPDWYKTTQHEGCSQYFSNSIGFWTWYFSIL